MSGIFFLQAMLLQFVGIARVECNICLLYTSLCAQYQYLLYPEIEDKVGEFVSETLAKVYELHGSLDKNYFHV